jgi:hypothetical protein
MVLDFGVSNNMDSIIVHHSYRSAFRLLSPALANIVSVNVRFFRQSDLNLVRSFRILTNIYSGIAHPFHQSASHHLFNGFANVVSADVDLSRQSYLNVLLDSGGLKHPPSSPVRRFGRFAFLVL